METVFQKFGLTDALIVSRGQLKQIAGGADPNPDAPAGMTLHCRCVGSVGCWHYSGTTWPNSPDSNVNMDIQQNCATQVGWCAYQDICTVA